MATLRSAFPGGHVRIRRTSYAIVVGFAAIVAVAAAACVGGPGDISSSSGSPGSSSSSPIPSDTSRAPEPSSADIATADGGTD